MFEGLSIPRFARFTAMIAAAHLAVAGMIEIDVRSDSSMRAAYNLPCDRSAMPPISYVVCSVVDYERNVHDFILGNPRPDQEYLLAR